VRFGLRQIDVAEADLLEAEFLSPPSDTRRKLVGIRSVVLGWLAHQVTPSPPSIIAAMPRLPADNADRTIYTVAQVRATDRAAIEGAGIPGYTLMTRAGVAALQVATDRYPGARRWQLLCGGGNNGGDGYVLARLAARAGRQVTVTSLSEPATLKGDARKAYDELLADGLTVSPFDGRLDDDASLLVDAMLGSGLARDVEGGYREAVEALNRHPAPVLALDIPTGLNGDSGRVMGIAVIADATVTFVGLKLGQFSAEGPAHCGKLVLADLDIPTDYRRGIHGVLRRLPKSALGRALPPRNRQAHKGDFGHVLIVGGGPGMPGAVRLAGEAALRAGAGLVTVATHPAHHVDVLARRPELMAHGVESPGDLGELLDRATVVAVGPGLGRGPWSQALFDAVIDADKPLVVDADGLNLLVGRPFRRQDCVLTPHPGEAARLLERSSADVQADRPTALKALADRFDATVVLKGAGSLVSSGSGLPWLCTAGNPGMASPGMGDALTGVIAALRAQGFNAEEAGVFGVELHAEAGDRAAADGERGLLALDLIARLRECANP